jgi:hypothetical protein
VNKKNLTNREKNTNLAPKRISMKTIRKPLDERNGLVEVEVPKANKKRKEGQKKEELEAIPKISRKTNFAITEKRLTEIRQFLDLRGDEYDIISSGISERMRFDGKTFIPTDVKEIQKNGYHLTNIVRGDIKNWLKNNADILIRRERDYTEQLFNLNNIEKNIGNVLISVDINDCYWRTAFLMGYITEKTYNKGLLVKGWKVGRNASIGTLAKTETITTYKNGQVARDMFGKLKKRVVRKDEDFQYIRHNIIGRVYDIFIELADILQDDFLMVLTDCVFTTIDKKKTVEDFLESKGYTCKNKLFEFTNVNRKDKYVEWIELKKLDTPKYYRYSEKQFYYPQKK